MVNDIGIDIHYSGDDTGINLMMENRIGQQIGVYRIKKITDDRALENLSELMEQVLGEEELLKVVVHRLIAITPDIVCDFQVMGSSDGQDSECLATLLGPGKIWLLPN